MKVAILIPTINREDFVERIVRYYNSVNSPHPIYIGDGSDREVTARTVDNLKKFGNVKVNYFHWEGLGPGRTSMRLAEMAQPECRYCAFHGDDDYFVPSSLARCAEFLAANKDYRTAQGRAAVFALDQPGPYGKIRGLGQYWGANGLKQETGLERFECFRNNYFVMQFSTHRTDEYLSDSEGLNQMTDGSLGELLQCHVFAINGKSKFLDCLYLIRSLHDGRAHIPEDGRAPADFVDWVMRSNWSSEVKKCLDFISLMLHESDAMSWDQARKVVTKGITELFKKNNSPNGDPVSKYTSFLPYLKSFLPMGLKNALRPLQRLTMEESDMRLLRSKRSLYHEDWLPVQRSLKRP